MNLNNLYKVQSSKLNNNEAEYSISLNSQHEIFDGHFPDFPLLPGVIQVEIIHKLIEIAVGNKLNLKESKNIKYLGMINPNEHKYLTIKLQWKNADSIRLKSQILAQDKKESIMMKFSANYSIEA